MAIDLEDRANALENEYFRRKEQELIEKMRAKIERENAGTSNLKCPKCEGTLVTSDYEGVSIDVCNKCGGAWLDAGELAQIAHKDEEAGWFGKLFK